MHWLTTSELETLEAVVERRAPELSHVLESLAQRQVVSAQLAARLRDIVGDELLDTGIDAKHGAVNERGRELDQLIDRVGQVSHLWNDET